MASIGLISVNTNTSMSKKTSHLIPTRPPPPVPPLPEKLQQQQQQQQQTFHTLNKNLDKKSKTPSQPNLSPNIKEQQQLTPTTQLSKPPLNKTSIKNYQAPLPFPPNYLTPNTTPSENTKKIQTPCKNDSNQSIIKPAVSCQR